MNKQVIQTKKGTTSYYILDDIYDGKITFFIKFDDEDSEHEFSIPETVLTIGDENTLAQVYSAGYEQGRHRGRWEKSKKLRELFNELKNMAL